MMHNLTDLNVTEQKAELKLICKILKPTGVYCVLLFLTSVISNLTILWIQIKNKMLFQHVNLLIFAIAILSLIGTVVELPLIITTSFKCK